MVRILERASHSSGCVATADGVAIADWEFELDRPAQTFLPLVYKSSVQSNPMACGIDVTLEWSVNAVKNVAPSERIRFGTVIPSPCKGQCQHGKGTVSPKQHESSGVTKHQINYIFFKKDGQPSRITKRDLKCIFCERRLPHSSFERLQFHYVTNHEYFNFLVEDSGKAGAIAERTIDVELADRLTQWPLDNIEDAQWVRPLRPFDVEQFLAGDESWITAKRRMARPRNLRPSTRRVKNKDATEDPSSFAVSTRAKAPEQVKPLPSRKRKRYVVPDIPGVTLYRNISKRVVEAGEELSESDDEIQVDWFEKQQRLRTVDDLSGPMQSFLKLLDAHVEAEGLSGDLHVSDALVRFCNARQQDRERPLVRQELKAFRTKLEQLHVSGLVMDSIYHHCVEFIETALKRPMGGHVLSPRKSPAQSKDQNQREMLRSHGHPQPKGGTQTDAARETTSVVSATDQTRLPVEERNGTTGLEKADATSAERPNATRTPRRAECVCGQVLTGMRKAVCCSKPVSTFQMSEGNPS